MADVNVNMNGKDGRRNGTLQVECTTRTHNCIEFERKENRLHFAIAMVTQQLCIAMSCFKKLCALIYYRSSANCVNKLMWAKIYCELHVVCAAATQRICVCVRRGEGGGFILSGCCQFFALPTPFMDQAMYMPYRWVSMHVFTYSLWNAGNTVSVVVVCPAFLFSSSFRFSDFPALLS